jgi:hypothetical protein
MANEIKNIRKGMDQKCVYTGLLHTPPESSKPFFIFVETEGGFALLGTVASIP